MEKILVIPDCHLESGVDPDPAYKLVRKIAKSIKFDRIVQLGDWLDLNMVSRFVDGSPGLVEGDRLSEELDMFRKEVRYFKNCCKSVMFLCGNHEVRIEKLLDRYPVLKGSIPTLRDICEDEDIEFIEVERQPYLLLPDLYITHGISYSKHYTSQNIERMGSSIIQGHAHRNQSFSYRYPTGETVTGWGLGTLGPVNPTYMAGTRVSGHSQSFGILSVDKDIWQMDVIMIEKQKCIINGKIYE